MQLFPRKGTKRVKRCRKKVNVIELYYFSCQMPYDEGEEMVECSLWKQWFHVKNINRKILKKSVHVQYEWLCDGCMMINKS